MLCLVGLPGASASTCSRTFVLTQWCVSGVMAASRGLFALAAPILNPSMDTSKPQRNRPLYSDTVIGTLAVDGWAVTFGTARRGLYVLRPRPGPSSLYQMQQPTPQRSVYQLHIIRCGTISICAH